MSCSSALQHFTTCHWLHMREAPAARDDTGVHVPTSITVLFFFFWGGVIGRQYQRFIRSAPAWLNVLSKMKARRRREEWNYGSTRAEQAARWVMFLRTVVSSWRSCRWVGCVVTWENYKSKPRLAIFENQAGYDLSSLMKPRVKGQLERDF